MTAALPDWLAAPLPAVAAVEAEITRALRTSEHDIRSLAALLSPAAAPRLEEMAQHARALTLRHFGRAIPLYAPLYLSNYCPASCTYCGFASDLRIARHKLSPRELDAELAALHDKGIEEILLLTGDRAAVADYAYVRDCVALAAGRFHCVAVEVFAMTEEEYRGLADAGCTSVTLYQETYDPVRYAALHKSGPKKDYLWRLEAPARALAAGIRFAGVGVLLGLSDPAADLLALYRHVCELRRRFWKAGIAISFPRIRPEPGGYQAEFPVDEAFLARIICAFRICLPDLPLVLSTRERPRFRDGMAGVGISKMSVASRTSVGGYDLATVPSGSQFDISDERDVATFCAALHAKGLQPVFKNWDGVYREPTAPVALTA